MVGAITVGAARKMAAEEEPLLDVAALKGKEEEEAAEKIKLQSAVRNYTTFLYVGFVFGTLAPRAAVKAAPAAVASAQRFLAGGYDLTVTVAFFAAATLLLQARLARALRPSTNTKARLTPLAAWSLAVVTWCCITSVFHHCLTFGDENLGGYGEWAASAGASFANLFMSARTVMRHLA
ncbi:uncharacterized protein LOC120693401 [Panicum virgatum]|uniref:Uncharacterized protein n=1 Tax=Panicum virgatum TaxID=38727 RepID=A0A8T0WHC0_PANVG|nr:uncharacterized protein LOC120693401 [Panicum virgatum]KAG2646578.1 hypothetical protein PVAP13_2KG522000 [Panicum virgatum]